MLRGSKCTRVLPVETFTKSNQVFDAMHCSAEIHHATTQRWRKLYETMRAKSAEITQDRPSSLEIELVSTLVARCAFLAAPIDLND